MVSITGSMSSPAALVYDYIKSFSHMLIICEWFSGNVGINSWRLEYKIKKNKNIKKKHLFDDFIVTDSETEKNNNRDI